jgi:hypothetical protein
MRTRYRIVKIQEDCELLVKAKQSHNTPVEAQRGEDV